MRPPPPKKKIIMIRLLFNLQKQLEIIYHDFAILQISNSILRKEIYIYYLKKIFRPRLKHFPYLLLNNSLLRFSLKWMKGFKVL